MTICLFLAEILHKLLFSNTHGDMQSSQEHLKTMVYAKFDGQTECIIGHSKIENYHCYCFCGHFLVGRCWREIGVRVLQESRKRVNGKIKKIWKNSIFDLKDR